jgi:N-methylhydantoinase A
VLTGLGLARRSPGEAVDLVHGSTVGLNAVLQGKLPNTAFVTNEGFVDLIEIGRQERSDLYDLEPRRPCPPVPRRLRISVDCRRGPDGRAERPLTQAAIAATVSQLRRLRPDAVAIGLLHSPTDPRDEQRLARAVRKALPDVPTTCSAELWPGFGEYERFSAAILNAAITPLVSDYMAGIEAGMGPGSMRLLRSSLGALPADEARRFPARAMFSGPAGGVLATERLGAAMGSARICAFDMGGTSTDVCLVEGEQLVGDGGSIAGLPLPLPGVAVHTVGCGGGSIAWCDEGGALRTGPHSAGADPGPACYGRGEEPTVTDAHVALGHIGADTLLGGGMQIDPDRSVRAIERLARKLNMSPVATARGILEVADVGMARALMRVTVEQAIDPGGIPLVAYGGAGGLHAASLCGMLGMPWAIAPMHAGVFSALGLALAGESTERTAALRERLGDDSAQSLDHMMAELTKAAQEALGRRGRSHGSVLLRYAGQGSGLRLALRRGEKAQRLAARFAEAHQNRFGFVCDEPIEIVQLQARVETPARAFPSLAEARPGKAGKAQGRRPPIGGGTLAVHRREELPLSRSVQGPCVLEEATAVTRVPDGWLARATPWGLQLQRRTG